MNPAGWSFGVIDDLGAGQALDNFFVPHETNVIDLQGLCRWILGKLILKINGFILFHPDEQRLVNLGGSRLFLGFGRKFTSALIIGH
jgi:hypothetical protein